MASGHVLSIPQNYLLVWHHFSHLATAWLGRAAVWSVLAAPHRAFLMAENQTQSGESGPALASGSEPLAM